MTKNTVPSAPADQIEDGELFAEDGRKLEDESFVGAKAPDADGDVASEPRPAPLKERSARPESESRK